MTRKDFELIAKVLKADRDQIHYDATHQTVEPLWSQPEERARVAAELRINASMAVRMADALNDTNPNFDRHRFLVAAGVAAA